MKTVGKSFEFFPITLSNGLEVGILRNIKFPLDGIVCMEDGIDPSVSNNNKETRHGRVIVEGNGNINILYIVQLHPMVEKGYQVAISRLAEELGIKNVYAHGSEGLLSTFSPIEDDTFMQSLHIHWCNCRF